MLVLIDKLNECWNQSCGCFVRAKKKKKKKKRNSQVNQVSRFVSRKATWLRDLMISQFLSAWSDLEVFVRIL